MFNVTARPLIGWRKEGEGKCDLISVNYYLLRTKENPFFVEIIESLHTVKTVILEEGDAKKITILHKVT